MRTMLFTLLAGVTLLGCPEDPVKEDTGMSDADTDTDTDADTDADTDSDTDADTDTDPPDPNACPQQMISELGTYMGSLIDRPSDLAPSCGSAMSGPEATFEFDTGVGGFYQLDTFGTGFDTVLTVFRRCNGIEVECNDDDPESVTGESSMFLALDGGETFIIAIEAADPTVNIGDGTVVLNISRREICGDDADNDLNGLVDCFDPACATGPTCCPLDVIPSPGSYAANLNNNPSILEPSCGGLGGSDVSWEFTPAVDGRYRFDTEGSVFDTILSVRDGCTGGIELACNDDIEVGGLASQIDIDLIGGTSYVVAVDQAGAGAPTFGGAVTLNVQLLPPEVCDDLSDNDQDGFEDCADIDCLGDPNCLVEFCDDGADNDADQTIDCADADCVNEPFCGPELCDDFFDNDGDGLEDCLDFDCNGDPACVETCDDGVDNDTDTLIDCLDGADCAT
ncbi:MAG: hypothetical protein AAF211_24430, partial [Myxococcota bacterium]